MENKLILPENFKQTYDKIVKMIETAKHKVFETAIAIRQIIAHNDTNETTLNSLRCG